jgi:hypothetical protein
VQLQSIGHSDAPTRRTDAIEAELENVATSRPTETNMAQRQLNNKQQKLQPRRDSQGKLRFFDAEGNQFVPPALAAKSNNSTIRFPDQINQETPPQDIVAQSPGSESQRLKRKAIDRAMREEPAKRSRPPLDGPSSPTPSAAQSSRPNFLASRHIKQTRRISSPAITRYVFDEEEDEPLIWSIPDDRQQSRSVATQNNTPGSAADAPQLRTVAVPQIILSDTEVSVSSEDDFTDDDFDIPISESGWDVDGRPEGTFLDAVDRVFRCEECGHELWTPFGPCSQGCTANYVHYYELIDDLVDPETGADLPDPETGEDSKVAGSEYAVSQSPSDPRSKIKPLLRPGIEDYRQDLDTTEVTNARSRRLAVGNYLDDHWDAYDTADEEPGLVEEYDEEDSFIDDASIDTDPGNEDASSSDGETDYKQLGNNLQAKYNQILVQYTDLIDEHEGLKKDLGLDGDDSNPSDMDDEEGLYMVEVENPDPTIFEIVLDQAEGQSQESEISSERVRDRAKAYEAVR